MSYLARYFETEPDGRLRCTLCPRDCRLAEGQAGFCFVRQNQGGRMVSLAYGRSTGFAADPVEKKPLNHFLPGTSALSFRASVPHTPGEVVDLALAEGCRSLAFTYNDPVIWAEWAIDVAAEARRRGLKTIFVTAGYVTPEARPEIFAHMDAANVDLKGFTEGFYGRVTLSHLAPVLDTLEWLAKETEVWVEVTNLVIPGLNDDPQETRALARWVVEHMGPEVPLHFSAFHPDFKMLDRPRTPAATLSRARDIARSEGLLYVYTGNVHDREGQTTWCPGCGTAVVERDWYAIGAVRLAGNRCAACGREIAGVFEGPIRRASGRRRFLGLA